MQIIPFLKSLESCTGMDIMLLSLYESESLRMAMEQLRRRGSQVSFHLLEGGDL